LKEKSGIINRSYSKRCQKLITDFGIEESFQMASARMKEHHGVDINVSAIRNITEFHAKRSGDLINSFPAKEKPSKQMIMELDGEMVPLVKHEESNDRRKTKKNFWAELRIGVAQNQGELIWKYAVSFKDPNHLGNKMLVVMKKMGLEKQTKVHGIGDGALWIPEQGKRIAGINYEHTIDLFHLCEYFSKAIAWTKNIKEEVKRLKNLCKKGKINQVLNELKNKQKQYKKHEGLKACIRYIENRPGQFEYKKAIEVGLPIGSGKVESSHRSLIQKRLKKPGTWWLKKNAENMANLRNLRANSEWNLLWQQNFYEKSKGKAA
jgi:hypothetical protein